MVTRLPLAQERTFAQASVNGWSFPLMQIPDMNDAALTLLHERHGHRIYRVSDGSRSFILKEFDDPSQAFEVQVYSLLRSLGVSTLPLHGHAPNALLLEDLDASADWRRATERDMRQPEVGRALAQWYGRLHEAGGQFLRRDANVPACLHREIDALDVQVIGDIARRLRLEGETVWQLAVEAIVPLKRAARALPQILTYNDFHWTNLALSRRGGVAVMYDFHLLGIGLRFSDCRNVTSVLVGEAQQEFWSAYGDVDQLEAVVDGPLATLYALSVAIQRPQLPVWSVPLVAQVTSGELEGNLRHAMEGLRC